MSRTDFAIRKCRPQAKPFKVADGGGLHLIVQPNGSRLWRWKYRFAGKEKLLSFDPYPMTALAEARRKRNEVKNCLPRE